VWGVGHGLSAAGYHHGGIACDDSLGPKNDGFDGRSADFVDSGSNSGFRKSGTDSTLACGVLAQAGEKLGTVEKKRKEVEFYFAESTFPKKISSTSERFRPDRSTAAAEELEREET
jgi:hypothetical protein